MWAVSPAGGTLHRSINATKWEPGGEEDHRLLSALRPPAKVDGDAPSEAADASDVQEVRKHPESSGDAEQEEHAHLGLGGWPSVLQDRQGRRNVTVCGRCEWQVWGYLFLFSGVQSMATQD